MYTIRQWACYWNMRLVLLPRNSYLLYRLLIQLLQILFCQLLRYLISTSTRSGVVNRSEAISNLLFGNRSIRIRKTGLKFLIILNSSSFYRIPNELMVKNWYKRTPNNFRFTAKFPKVMTHDKRLNNFDEDQLDYLAIILSIII
jgi:hypothetical protein